MSGLENTIFDIAEALETPVLILALAALALVTVELGAFAVEVARRRRRSRAELAPATERARQAMLAGRRDEADAILVSNVSRNRAMSTAIERIVAAVGWHGADEEMSKALADYDYGSMARLERTRLLVRAGPALGLMGTLILLSPALTGLADGDVATLSENLRVAFSVTVLGLLVGAIAFGISLVRDRLYGQDLSELEYIAARLGEGSLMAIQVRSRARSRPDRGGDPLDGLVNLFDLGIVLSVAFLLAALSSINLTDALTEEGQREARRDQVEVSLEHSRPLPPRGEEVSGRGTEVGTVYRLEDGSIVYVKDRTP